MLRYWHITFLYNEWTYWESQLCTRNLWIDCYCSPLSLSLSLSLVVVCRQPYPPFNWTNSTSRLKSRRQHIRICALEFLKYTRTYLLAWLLCHQQYQLLYLLLDYHKDWVSPAKFKPNCITYRILFAHWLKKKKGND